MTLRHAHLIDTNFDLGGVITTEQDAVRSCLDKHLQATTDKMRQWMAHANMRLIPFPSVPQNGNNQLRYVIEETNLNKPDGGAVILDGIYYSEKYGWAVSPVPAHVMASEEE